MIWIYFEWSSAVTLYQSGSFVVPWDLGSSVIRDGSEVVYVVYVGHVLLHSAHRSRAQISSLGFLRRRYGRPPVLDGDIICIAPSELPERSRKWVTLEADALDYS